ncbi:PilZ domain-containing protein [Sphingomonas sp. NSE70-1]|uniref:PilZ domain-containing protein n=1 Tax=Sphingomonas caseinilyticus TaxID=2908205 RepID=A0ABT0RWP5_9SPHN|nr:PilZ domain-containing protein [Sphingomonas caseinilyticus]
MASFPSPDDFADRRAHPRVEVALPAFLEANGERHSVQLIDLSSGGTKLSCSLSIAAGSEVTLDCGTFIRSAIVRWQGPGVLGLCFASELDAREVSAMADRSNALVARMTPKDGRAS